MTSAASQRGNYLEGLEEGLNNVSVSASTYLSSAKNAAVCLAFFLPTTFTNLSTTAINSKISIPYTAVFHRNLVIALSSFRVFE